MTQHSKPILTGITATLVVVACAFTYYLHTTYLVAADEAAVSIPSTPARLKVPALGADAPIELVGRTSSGNMESPTSLTGVAWFKEGAIPGQRGSAVIAGHLNSSLGRSGVFKNLDTLKVGDEVLVETVSGDVLRFRVIRTQVYPYDAAPVDLFTRADGTYLNLITCAGEWYQKAKTYDKRLVVYTELVP